MDETTTSVVIDGQPITGWKKQVILAGLAAGGILILSVVPLAVIGAFTVLRWVFV